MRLAYTTDPQKQKGTSLRCDLQQNSTLEECCYWKVTFHRNCRSTTLDWPKPKLLTCSVAELGMAAAAKYTMRRPHATTVSGRKRGHGVNTSNLALSASSQPRLMTWSPVLAQHCGAFTLQWTSNRHTGKKENATNPQSSNHCLAIVQQPISTWVVA